MRKLTDQQKIEIVEKYLTGNYNCSSLGKEYGILKSSVNRLLRYRNIQILSRSKSVRRYTLNENYFDVIDNEHKAYWLGLLYADGTNSDKTHCIQLRLQESDLSLLEKFNIDIGSNCPIGFIERKSKHPTWQNLYRLTINSIHISKALSKLGCVPNKTFKLKFPTEDILNTEYIRPFLRGLWDGDGSFSLSELKLKKSKNKGFKIISSLVSTEEVCKDIQSYLKVNLKINSTICYAKKNSNKNTKRLRISGNQQVIKFLDWLYENSTISLDRKFVKLKHIKDTLLINGWKSRS